jgi:hypothetical protein
VIVVGNWWGVAERGELPETEISAISLATIEYEWYSLNERVGEGRKRYNERPHGLFDTGPRRSKFGGSRP